MRASSNPLAGVLEARREGGLHFIKQAEGAPEVDAIRPEPFFSFHPLPRDHRAGTLGNAFGMPALRSALSMPRAEVRSNNRKNGMKSFTH